MLSIYTLVAERRDRNQSLKRRRHQLNYNDFKRSISEKSRDKDVTYRQPAGVYSNARYRTVSDTANNVHLKNMYNVSNRNSAAPTITETNNVRYRTDSQADTLRELHSKMDKMQDMFNKQYEEMKRELHLLRLRLDS